MQVEAARTFIQGNPSHQHKMDQLSTDCQALQRSLEVRAVIRPRPWDLTLLDGSFPPFLPSFLLTLFSPSLFPFPFLMYSAGKLLHASCVPGSVLGPKDGAT